MKGCISGFSLALLFLATSKPISNSGYSLQTSKNRNNLLQSHYNLNSDTGFVVFFFHPIWIITMYFLQNLSIPLSMRPQAPMV